MGKRARRRGAVDKLEAPTTDYADERFGTLTLRGVLTPATRRRYAEARAGKGGAQTQEDAWQRAVELLFERLVARWDSSGVAYERQGDLVMRYRAATPDERRWVRDVLREHCEEWFPDVEAP
jgi:hypothetical protein